MEWLLKIVEGPMNGAEIALVNGMRVSFGRDAGCDIVIADAALAEKAFELDVTEESVSLVAEGGEPRALRPFEIQTFGTTSFALGPAEGAWEELRKPEPSAEAASSPHQEEEGSSDSDAEGTPRPQENAEERQDAEETPRPQESAEEREEAEGTPPPQENGAGAPRSRKRVLVIGGGVLLLLLVLIAVLTWLFWPQARAWYDAHLTRQTDASAAVATAPTLAEIAKQHGLTLERPTLSGPSNLSNPSSLLKGNLKRRTERLAIRALALAADPTVKLDLTDDETLRAAAEALLFTVSEGAVKVTAAANRKVSLSGGVGSRAELEGIVRALSADVAGLEGVDAAGVTVGGSVKRETPVAAEEPDESPVRPSVAKPKKGARPVLPVAGILTVPYPCVVMHNGMRFTEGALVGRAKLVKIEADRLTFEDAGRTFEWRP